ncbi:MAG: hypothetical protein ACLFQV_09900 [Vulcanimicrobiota bacterium]
MAEMRKIPYDVEINIGNIPTRYCRYYQEQIFDYYDDGRARFEWDRLRQDFMLGLDFTIEEVCSNCPLNIILDVEGCRGRLFDFDIFLRMLSNVKPDSLLFQKNIKNAEFSREETENLLQEMEQLQQYCKNITWPVAQVFCNDEPVQSEESVKYNQMVYYEWGGEEAPNFFASNQGYHAGITKEGIILKKNFGETLPNVFVSLSRKGLRMKGTDLEGNLVPVPMNRATLPDWWPEDPYKESELKFTSLPVSFIFYDIFNMIIVYGQMALQHYTGINIFSKFYRRA